VDLLGGVMGLPIVGTITYAGTRIGVAATAGVVIAGSSWRVLQSGSSGPSSWRSTGHACSGS
jgi:hypothetical protein